jgi:hypothetical protein
MLFYNQRADGIRSLICRTMHRGGNAAIKAGLPKCALS